MNGYTSELALVIDQLEQVPSLRDSASRRLCVDLLSEYLGAPLVVDDLPTTRAALIGIVQACRRQHPRALNALIDVVELMEPGSRPVQQARAAVEDMTASDLVTGELDGSGDPMFERWSEVLTVLDVHRLDSDRFAMRVATDPTLDDNIRFDAATWLAANPQRARELLELIEESSLGTAQARQLRATSSPTQISEVLIRADDAAASDREHHDAAALGTWDAFTRLTMAANTLEVVSGVGSQGSTAQNPFIAARHELSQASHSFSPRPLPDSGLLTGARLDGEAVQVRVVEPAAPEIEAGCESMASVIDENSELRLTWNQLVRIVAGSGEDVVAVPGLPVAHTHRPELTSGEFGDMVRRAARYDYDGLTALFDLVRPFVVLYNRCRIGTTGSGFETADDLAQEVCFDALRRVRKFATEPSEFVPFLFSMAAGKVNQVTARDTAPKDFSDEPSTTTPALVVAMPTTAQKGGGSGTESERANWVTAVLDTLPGQQREVVVLRLIVGLSAGETAHALGVRASSVRATQHRALAKIRAALSRQEAEAEGKWSKSNYSEATGDCVEVRFTEATHVRDSKNTTGPTLVFSDGWATFIARIKESVMPPLAMVPMDDLRVGT